MNYDRVQYAKDLLDSFMQYVNSFYFGRCKEWKANGILMTMAMDPEIPQDRDELYKYLVRCLAMEGFVAADCEEICDWCKDKWDKFEKTVDTGTESG